MGFPRAGIVFFFLSCLLSAQITQQPAASLFVDQGYAALEEGRYEDALALFQQASQEDRDNKKIEAIVSSLSRLVDLKDLESDSDTIDAFLAEREKTQAVEEKETMARENQDFITRQRKKELARLERPLGEIALHFPLIYSSRGNGETDNLLRVQGDPLKGLGYGFVFFPEIFNRIIGIESRYFSYPLYLEKDPELSGGEGFIFDEARLGVVLKNYFNEEPGSYSLLGTKISTGLLFENNRTASRVRIVPSLSWQFELFVRDPVFYRWNRDVFFRNLAFEGRVQFSLVEDTYMLNYGVDGHFKLGNIVLSSSFLYRNYLLNEEFYSSWMVSAGISVLFL